MSVLLRIEDLYVQFGTDEGTVHAVNGLNLELKAGGTVAIVGESGSGKSTAMTALMRLLPRTARVSGHIWFDGQDLLSLSSRQVRRLRGHHISMVFQNPMAYLNPTKTIGQQLMEPLLYHHLATPRQAQQQALDFLERVGIASARARFSSYPFEFSGGMLQRVMIAMGLIAGPKLLIADEPTTALDVTVQAEILALLKELQAEHGMGMVLVTHDMAVAAQMADEVYVMYGGMVVEHLPSHELMKGEAHPYLRGLLRSIPRIDGRREKLPFIAGNPVNTVGTLPHGCLFASRCPHRRNQCSERPPLVKLGDRHEVMCWLPYVDMEEDDDGQFGIQSVGAAGTHL
ncbi:ABC transporter ATP-binding protein [Alicyclobacillus shizuokensis]|uniref:ABC transporter ATP-binding protein n=1 Tax=Alicyclobacillus shizuokensis TaxID=392014 RepID=UPI00082F97ED|nr:ABC transporter ATP-binding protein [Alicyclobacillus shizuokensis]MCL6625104.1 ABC transporter ATP-binding protein [Alicyclobacillus shizuokensis]